MVMQLKNEAFKLHMLLDSSESISSPDGGNHEVHDCQAEGNGRHLHEQYPKLYNTLHKQESYWVETNTLH